MKCFVSFVCVLSVLFAVGIAAPAPQQVGFSASTNLQVGGSASAGASASAGGNPLTNILSNVDLPGLLRGINSFVGLIRQFCPPLGQLLDNVIQNVTSTAFRVFGRILLQNGGLGGGGSGGAGGGGRVSVVLPTFPPDDDEDYDDEDDEASNSSSNGGSDVSSRLSNSPTTEPNSELVSAVAADNTVDKRHVRVVREANEEFEEEEEDEEDQDGAESAPQPSEDLSNVNIDDQDRNKRFLPFGASVDAHGSNGGSGNFLFDIIRLVAGSGATEEGDEKAHSPGGVAEVDISKSGAGYTEGIPGPITRLFVIANRGLANLVQDLILRLAQTSEKFVNFKARLVTSLI